MIDLRGIARRLRLSVDQVRLAADLLEQGYQPSFIERYRADETGCLPRATLWALKLEIDRQLRLAEHRRQVQLRLPKDAELDEEAAKFLESATTEVEIEATLRCFRARRSLAQTQERDSSAGQLLQALIAYEGSPIEDLSAWTQTQLGVDEETAKQTLEQTQRLVSNLIQCDTQLNERLRRTVQKKAQIQVEFLDPNKSNDSGNADETDSTDTEHTDPSDTNAQASNDATAQGDASAESQVEQDQQAQSTSDASVEAGTEPAPPEAASSTEVIATEAASASAPANAVDGSEAVPAEAAAPEAANPSSDSTETAQSSESASVPEQSTGETQPEEAAKSADHKPEKNAKKNSEKTTAKASKKSAAKMTPRQRRRRWLIAMLQPMKSLKRQVTKLTAYQQLMLGRGRRSQLVNTPLSYDRRAMYSLARDAFVVESHPLSKWFEDAAKESLDQSWLAKMEADALADLEELAQERLLETAADPLRQNLMRRPVRGHVIMVVDTVGPKASSVAIVGAKGEVLATEEISCSALPDVVNQNVVRLGELAHRHKVTLVALTNGPARRFLVLTVRELMKQSAASGLRWTMADRSGAEAYAAGRVALKELSAHNRRDRAAIWIGRCLQNPLGELLKGDVNRLRLGSYQRELPQEPLKKLVRETIADCVCHQGIDTLRASVDELQCVAGVESEQAQQIATLAAQGNLASRKQLLDSVAQWPEPAARQAIPVLRVYGSEEVLDATSIHPEDYRLAQRLIENTELNAPPAAPDGWTPPEADTQLSSAAIAPQAESATDEQATASEAPAAESTETSDAATEIVAEATSEAPAEESGDASPEPPTEPTEPPTDAAAESESSESAEVAQEEVAAKEISEPEAEQSAAPAAEPAEPAANENATAAPEVAGDQPKPEYSEDVVPVATTNPAIDTEKLARGWQVGREKLKHIAAALHDPFGDPRLAETPIPMLGEMPSLSSLQPEMCVWAVVVGVADFGAFVEIAPECSGLIHISRLSANYVEDPHQVVQVGDLLLAWVVAIDEKKNRVALTALSPAERAANKEAENQRTEDRRERRGGNRRQGAEGQSRDGQSVHTSGRGAPGGRPAGSREQGQGGARGGNRGRQGGGRGGNQGRGGGRNSGPHRTSKPVVVTSKKPKAPISEAMKEGEEPLRSFSDLMQFYEAKRTDDAPAPKAIEVKPASVTVAAKPADSPAEAPPQGDPAAGSGTDASPADDA